MFLRDSSISISASTCFESSLEGGKKRISNMSQLKLFPFFDAVNADERLISWKSNKANNINFGEDENNENKTFIAFEILMDLHFARRWGNLQHVLRSVGWSRKIGEINYPESIVKSLWLYWRSTNFENQWSGAKKAVKRQAHENPLKVDSFKNFASALCSIGKLSCLHPGKI